MTVTLVPNLAYTEPIYNPITPPPITIKSFGTFASDKAPVDEMITFSSNYNPGNGLTSLPVAIIKFLAVIY